MKTEAYKLYSGVFWIFLPNFIKIAPCNSELYRFKVKTFFFRHSVYAVTLIKLVNFIASKPSAVFEIQEFKSINSLGIPSIFNYQPISGWRAGENVWFCLCHHLQRNDHVRGQWINTPAVPPLFITNGYRPTFVSTSRLCYTSVTAELPFLRHCCHY